MPKHNFYLILFFALLFLNCNKVKKQTSLSINGKNVGKQTLDLEIYYKVISLYKITIKDSSLELSNCRSDIEDWERSIYNTVNSIPDKKIEQSELAREKDGLIHAKIKYKNLKTYYYLIQNKIDSLILNRPSSEVINYEPNYNQFSWKQNWNKLEKGMNYKQALKTLGVPSFVNLSNQVPIYIESFYYVNNDISGTINFDNNGIITKIKQPFSQ